jgi:hypothetical protein
VALPPPLERPQQQQQQQQRVLVGSCAGWLQQKSEAGHRGKGSTVQVRRGETGHVQHNADCHSVTAQNCRGLAHTVLNWLAALLVVYLVVCQ